MQTTKQKLFLSLKGEWMQKEIYPEFGKLLSEIRKARKLSITDAAALFGLSGSYWSRLEQGYVPKPETLVRILKTFSVDEELGCLLYGFTGRSLPMEIFDQLTAACLDRGDTPFLYPYGQKQVQTAGASIPFFLRSDAAIRQFAQIRCSSCDREIHPQTLEKEIANQIQRRDALLARTDVRWQCIVSELTFQTPFFLDYEGMLHQIDFIINCIQKNSHLFFRILPFSRTSEIFDPDCVIVGDLFAERISRFVYEIRSTWRCLEPEFFFEFRSNFDDLWDRSFTEGDSIHKLVEVKSLLQGPRPFRFVTVTPRMV